MKSLDVKIAYLGDDFKIIGRNKEFYSYFEKAGFLYENVDELVATDQKHEFLDFVKMGHHDNEFRAYLFKKITGEYFYNIVWVRDDTFNDKKCLAVRITDISHAYEFFKEASSAEKRLCSALSITNEYLFMYQKSTNIFTLHNFMQNQRTVVAEQDLDSWVAQMISEGLIEKTDEAEFKSKIKELKNCDENFSFSVTSSLRFNHSISEKLVFEANRLEDDGEIFMIGRIMPEIFVEQSEKSNKLLREIKLDSLTGAYNKKAILDFAEKRFAPGTRENAVLAIVDLDHFKPVNDAYGHLAGDKVLKKAGEVLRNIIGEAGVIGRYGGDEFLVILEDMAEESVFRGTLRTINTDMKSAFEGMFTDISVTVSIGASQYPKDGATFDELFKKADFCLYRAKDKGRDRYVFFRDDLHGELYKKASESKTEGIKYDVREVLELKSMADFLLDLGTNPRLAADTVLSHMLKTYNLGSINIYYGEKMERVYTIGEKPEKLANADYVFGKEFKNALNGKNFIRVDFTTDLKENAKPFGDILDERGVKSTIQCLLGTAEKPLGLVTFDRLKEGALWAEYEMNCCVMFGAAVNLLPAEKVREIFEK